MTLVGLARLQFGLTIIFHFLFVPTTIGLSLMIALLETLYWRDPKPHHRLVIDFFGRLFLINFAVGVVTGILQEFQFGMNWAAYSRFVGDVFGAPLAIESLLAFFMESTFVAVWIFGWEQLPPRVHLASIWLVAVGVSLSAFNILVANSFMQEPVGFRAVGHHLQMVNFWALLTNPQLWVEFPHVELAAITTGAFLMLGISALYLQRGQYRLMFMRPFRIALAVSVVSSILVVVMGHTQAQHLVHAQPMKIAASEALWQTSGLHAAWSLIAWINPVRHTTHPLIAIPYLLSILAYNRLTGRIPGIDALQRLYVHRYGPGWYVPPVVVTFWSFRIMIGLGFALIAVAVWGAILVRRRQLLQHRRFLRLATWSMLFPPIANIMGWVMTEVGRQPWIVFGLMQTRQGISTRVPLWNVLLTLSTFGALYAAIGVTAFYLALKYIRLGPIADEPGPQSQTTPLDLSPQRSS
jgi:cytochrome d ubiquinol oxidase subunit I